MGKAYLTFSLIILPLLSCYITICHALVMPGSCIPLKESSRTGCWRRSRQRYDTRLVMQLDEFNSSNSTSNNINSPKQGFFARLFASKTETSLAADQSDEDMAPEDDDKSERRKPFLSRVFQLATLACIWFVVSPILSGELTVNEPWDVRARYPSPRNLAPQLMRPKQRNIMAEEDDSKSESSEFSSTDNLDSADLKSHSDKSSSRRSQATQDMSVNEKRSMALSFVTESVKKVGPSVVRIDTETHFDDEGEPDGISPRGPSSITQGQGSGLIFSRDGFVLTNAHVVEDATKVTVTLTDGRIYLAEVKGADEIVDIAVLRIIPDRTEDGITMPLSNLPVADLGNSDDLNVGQIVVAVGSPGGLDNTVTMGIVSGLERSSHVVGIPHKKIDYIQTDAAINPGNSGGPLIDVETSKVVGINAAIRAHMEGTSFAIPINRVRDIMHDLAEGNEVHHGYLGISLATCTPEWARQNNARATQASVRIPEVYGALVHKVFPKTPAEYGGLRENDVLLEIGGERVESSDDARRLIDEAPINKELVVKILRDKRQLSLLVRPVDLASRLREIRQERQQQLQNERLRFQELGPFRLQ